MKKILLILALLGTVQAMNGEAATSLPQRNPSLPATIAQEQVLIYGSLSLAPGIGVSDRSRIGSQGNAIDYKLGVASIPVIDSVHALPIFSVDYNFFHYFRSDKEISPYVSYGIGAIYFVPYVPLRAGIQFPSGFIDLGAKMILGLLPAPEIRGGINLKF